MARLVLREREVLVGVRPGSKPAHTSPVIGYPTTWDIIVELVALVIPPTAFIVDPQ